MFTAAHADRVRSRIQERLPTGTTVQVSISDDGQNLSALVPDPRDPNRIVISTAWQAQLKRDGSPFGGLQPSETSLRAIAARFGAVAEARNIGTAP